jgi:hypothetical protein
VRRSGALHTQRSANDSTTPGLCQEACGGCGLEMAARYNLLLRYAIVTEVLPLTSSRSCLSLWESKVTWCLFACGARIPPRAPQVRQGLSSATAAL